MSLNLYLVRRERGHSTERRIHFTELRTDTFFVHNEECWVLSFNNVQGLQTLQERIPSLSNPLPPSVYLGGHCCGSHDETSQAFHLSFTTANIQKPNSSDSLGTRLHVCVPCVCTCVYGVCMSLCVCVRMVCA